MQSHMSQDEQDHVLRQSHAQLTQANKRLREALQRGQSVVEQIWKCNTRAWATSVHGTDIDGDGDIEILVGLRDGRVCALTKRKALKWTTATLDNGQGIESVVGIPRWSEKRRIHVLAGSRNGTVFGLDDKGIVIDQYNIGAGIRQIYLDPQHPDVAIVGCDDRCVYALDTQTLKPVWDKFATGGAVRSVFSYDADEDGELEIFAASSDHNIYVLSSSGDCRAIINTGKYKVYTLCVARLYKGEVTLLGGTNYKKLLAWHITHQEGDEYQLHFQEKRLPLFNEDELASRIRTICTADINRDGYPEILIGTDDKSLSLLDRTGKMLFKHDLEQFVAEICAIDIDFDGVTEVLVGVEDNNIQLLRVELDKHPGEDTPYENILTRYTDFSQKERRLLSYLIGTQKQSPQYRHMEWNWVELFIAQRKYEEALSLLLKLRRQGFQHLWSEAVTVDGPIRVIDSGNHSRDAEYEITVGTEDGHLIILDIKPSAGYKILQKELNKGIYKLETLANPDFSQFDHILVGFDDQSLSMLDYTGKLLRNISIAGKESGITNFFMYKKYSDRSYDAISEVLLALTDGSICIYDNSLSQEITAFKTGHDIQLCCSDGNSNMTIVIATAQYHIYAYTRAGEPRWSYERIRGRIRALHIRDIDGDSFPEVIIGSEDCSVYVLNHDGLLKWRYLTPHRVLNVEIADIDENNNIEILIGCENSYLYVLNGAGDLLWMHKIGDRITAIHAQDLHQYGSNPDGKIEIALGTERQLELLQVLDLRTIIHKIDFCWKEWQELLSFDDPRGFIRNNAKHKNIDIRTFVIAKLAGSSGPEYTAHIDEDLTLIERILDDQSLEVRLELARIAINLERSHGDYPRCMEIVRKIFQELRTDPRIEVKLTVVDRLPSLKDTSLCFEYLERFISNEDAWVRRSVIRTLDALIDDHPDKVFQLLLKTAKAEHYGQDEVLADDERDWIHQEVGRSLARYFSVHQEMLFRGIQDLVAQGSDLQVIQQISYSSPDVELRDLFDMLIQIMRLPNESNEQRRNAILEKLLDGSVRALSQIARHDVRNSQGILQVYKEFRQLFGVRSIDEIEKYQWTVEEELIESIKFISPVTTIFLGLIKVIDKIRRYQKRQIMGERLAALIQAYDHLNKLHAQIESNEADRLRNEEETEHTQKHLMCPPEDHILLHILTHWITIIFAEIERIRGKATLRYELKRKHAWFEAQIVIVLQIVNEGHCPAEDVSVYLEKSAEFAIEMDDEVALDEINTKRPTTIEFTIRPITSAPRLVFHIAYRDAEGQKTFTFADILILETHKGSFKAIPDEYRVGLPLRLGEQDRKLFVGRGKDLSLLQEKLTVVGANSMVVLSGQRRSGKTSLLYRLIGEIEEQSHHIPVFIDLQGLVLLKGVGLLLREFAQLIIRKVSNMIQPPILKAEDFRENPTSAFESFLQDTLLLLFPRKLIFLIDEFEVLQGKMHEGELPPAFLEYLRSLIQHKQGVSLLIAGTPKIRNLLEWYWSAFFNIAYTHRLSTLEKDEAEELITAPISKYLTYDSLALEKMHRLTNDQPYLLQLMSAAMIKHCNKLKKTYVTINDVNVICDEVVSEQQNHFIWIWNQLKGAPIARLILSVLAQREDDGILPPGGITLELETLGYHVEQIELLEALNTLVEEEFIEEEHADEAADICHYRIPVGLTRAWLRTMKPLQICESEVSRSDNESVER